MNWYNFKENAKILEMDQDFNINNNVNQEFDYVIIKDDLSKIEMAKKCLKQDGTILLCLNNRFGVKYFAGCKKDGKPFSTICSESTNVYGKTEIEQILHNNGFINYKFFYPLPDYENPSSIFSDDYLPDYTNTKLLYNSCYEDNEVFVFNELEALKQITKSGDFTFFANSYIVEINPQKQLKFASFNNSRKPKYRLMTKMYDEYVVKTPMTDEVNEHIFNMKDYIIDLQKYDINIIDKFEDNKIISKYVNNKTLIEIIAENIKNKDIQKSYDLMQKWYDFIKIKFEAQKTDKLNECVSGDNGLINGLTVVKKAYIDLVFENTFIENNDFIFFDQEWCFDNLPLEFILYRAVNNLYVYNYELDEILPKDDIYKKFGIDKFLKLFEQIEEYIQNVIVDVKNTKMPAIIEDVSLLQGIIDEKNEQFHRQDKYIKELENYEREKWHKIEELQQKLGLVEIDNKKKQEYIESLEKYKAEKEKENQDLKGVIEHLNEIIKVKDHQILCYENTRVVKLAKKFRKQP